MSRRELSMTFLEEIEAWKADGFDNAIIGVGQQFTEGGQIYVYIYSQKAILDIIADDIVQEINNRVKTSDEERKVLAEDAWDQALEYFNYNIAGAYIGRGMPVFLDDLSE